MIISSKTQTGIQSLLNLPKEQEITKAEPLVYSQKLRMIEYTVFQKAIKPRAKTNQEENIYKHSRKQNKIAIVFFCLSIITFNVSGLYST